LPAFEILKTGRKAAVAEAVDGLLLVLLFFKAVDGMSDTAKLVNTNNQEMAALATRCLDLKSPLQATQSRLTAEKLIPLREILCAPAASF
jgi:hypothetical protein